MPSCQCPNHTALPACPPSRCPNAVHHRHHHHCCCVAVAIPSCCPSPLPCCRPFLSCHRCNHHCCCIAAAVAPSIAFVSPTHHPEPLSLPLRHQLTSPLCQRCPWAGRTQRKPTHQQPDLDASQAEQSECASAATNIHGCAHECCCPTNAWTFDPASWWQINPLGKFN